MSGRLRRLENRGQRLATEGISDGTMDKLLMIDEVNETDAVDPVEAAETATATTGRQRDSLSDATPAV